MTNLTKAPKATAKTRAVKVKPATAKQVKAKLARTLDCLPKGTTYSTANFAAFMQSDCANAANEGESMGIFCLMLERRMAPVQKFMDAIGDKRHWSQIKKEDVNDNSQALYAMVKGKGSIAETWKQTLIAKAEGARAKANATLYKDQYWGKRVTKCRKAWQAANDIKPAQAEWMDRLVKAIRPVYKAAMADMDFPETLEPQRLELERLLAMCGIDPREVEG